MFVRAPTVRSVYEQLLSSNVIRCCSPPLFQLMQNMELQTDEIFDNSTIKYSSELTSQDKMIIRIKKQEQDVDIEGKDSDSSDSEEIVSYTCEFVQKVDDTKSEFSDICDEPIESVRQDENFIYPAITHSDEEDTNDVTWQPRERVTRKHIKCLYPKVDKSQKKKNNYKSSKSSVKLTIKRIKKEQVSNTENDLEDIYVTKSDADSFESNITVTSDSIPKKANDPPSPKVSRPRKGMATPKQRLGRILKIHKMMK